MRHVYRVGVLLLLIASCGCATRGWVLEQLGGQQAAIVTEQVEMSQRIDQIGSETQRVNKRVDGVEGGVRQGVQNAENTGARLGAVESSVRSASEAARGAREQAAAAMTKAEEVEGRLAKLLKNQQNTKPNRHNTKTVDTLHVQFGFDRSDLDDGAQTTLLDLVKEVQANPNLIVELVGYTDTKGGRE